MFIWVDGSIRIVNIRFTGSNSDIVPMCLSESAPPHEKPGFRGQKRRGELMIDATDRVSTEEFVRKLLEEFDVFDGFFQNMNDVRSKNRVFYAVQFLLARRPVFKNDRLRSIEDAREALVDLCQSAFWRIRVYRNPFVENGQLVEGAYALSIVLDARTPRFKPDGSPVVSRRAGEDEPMPIEPDEVLRLGVETEKAL